MIRAYVFVLLGFIVAVGGTVIWLNAGGEPRKHWFWCEALDLCGPPSRKAFLDRDLTPPPTDRVLFRPRREK